MGILHQPDSGVESARTVLVLLNSGLIHRAGPFRMYTQLARKLQKAGVVVIRIDQAGRGDSSRRVGCEMKDAIRADFEDVLRYIDQHFKDHRIVVGGLCSGARDSLFLASEYSNISGAILLDGYARRTFKYYRVKYIRHLFRLRSWKQLLRQINTTFLQRARFAKRIDPGADATDTVQTLARQPDADEARHQFLNAFENNCRFLCIFTKALDDCYNYEGQLSDFIGIQESPVYLTEMLFPDAQHTYPLSIHREWLFDRLEEWLVGIDSRSSDSL